MSPIFRCYLEKKQRVESGTHVGIPLLKFSPLQTNQDLLIVVHGRFCDAVNKFSTKLMCSAVWGEWGVITGVMSGLYAISLATLAGIGASAAFTVLIPEQEMPREEYEEY